MENNTAKHFVLQLGSLASLYLSLSFLLVLVFGLINLAMPDAADGAWEITRAQEGIKIGIAMVVVFFPTYLLLTRTVNQNRRQSANHAYLGLTKWLIYLSLLVGGAVLLGDLVAVIMAFLEGDLTTRFILKALSILVAVGGAFTYYLKDVKGAWLNNEKSSKQFGLIATVIVVVTVIAGITQVESPSEARAQKIDNEMVGHLQDMQWRIEDYYRSNEKLPENLEEVYGAFEVPTAPDNKPPYTYKVESETEYSLCANFNFDSNNEFETYARPGLEKNYDWRHKAGDWCFEREIDNIYRQ